MTVPLRLTCKVKFGRTGAGGRKEMRPAPPNDVAAARRVPRVARLMALAIRLDGLIRSGQLRDQAEVARVGRVTRARVTQIMNLLLLAPDIQEQLLWQLAPARGRAGILLRDLQPIAQTHDWEKQREMWVKLRGS